MELYVGISRSHRRVRAVCDEARAPMMMSAGSLYRDGRLRAYPRAMHGARVAIDSAGFTAMTVHGGVYPWTAGEYLDLIEAARPLWYASRDYCVEPEIADSADARAYRIAQTVDEFGELSALAASRGLPAPVPVLQGRYPDEYIECWAQLGHPVERVGLGSVCRRGLRGPDGLIRILDELAAEGVRGMHLFGVKGTALGIIARDLFMSAAVSSVDSHAWDFACRKAGIKTIDGRERFLRQWITRQQRRALGRRP